MPLSFRYKKVERSSAGSTLGEGAYGVVYKAIDLQENKSVALKKIRLSVEDEGIPVNALREIVLLRQLEHPNVVKLENVVMFPGKLYLAFELIDTDLKKYMDANVEGLSQELIRSYTSQIMDGITYCHSLGVMHRDLKPQNILVTRDGGLKIAGGFHTKYLINSFVYAYLHTFTLTHHDFTSYTQ